MVANTGEVQVPGGVEKPTVPVVVVDARFPALTMACGQEAVGGLVEVDDTIMMG